MRLIPELLRNKEQTTQKVSFLRKQESRPPCDYWIPAFAGMTEGAFRKSSVIQQIKSIIIIVLLISFSTFTGCQMAPHARIFDDSKSGAQDTADTKQTPAKRDYTAVKYLGATVGSTAVLTLVDRPVRRYVTSSSNNTMDGMTDVAMTFGETRTLLYISRWAYPGRLIRLAITIWPIRRSWWLKHHSWPIRPLTG